MPDVKLSKLQKDILSFFGKDTLGKNFYWTGGTLLAYQYFHHRFSVDLDFFSNDLFADNKCLEFINRLKKYVGAEKITFTLQYNRRLYLVERGKEILKLEIVFFPFPAIEKRKTLPEFSLKIDSLTDIIINKTLSIYQRNEVKDVYDLYCYLTNRPKYDLFKLIDLVEKKFGVAIEPALLLAKINELTTNLDNLQPFSVTCYPELTKKVKTFFQRTFNLLAKKRIK